MNAYQKCESLLRNYNSYKISLEHGADEITQKCVDKIDKAVYTLSNEKYIGIVKLHYIDGVTMERIAELYDISTVAVYKRKKRLINKLKNILCSDEAIREILES